MDNTKRIWKRESRYVREYVGKTKTFPAHILETVDIDLVKNDCMTPTVTLHNDETVSIHDQCNWGSIRMTAVQALHLAERIKNAITH